MNSKSPSLHTGHRARMRNRYYETGLSGFQMHEIVELLLFCSIPKKDVNPLAHQLIDRFGSLGGVLAASEEELLSVPGVGQSTCDMIRALNRVCVQYGEVRHIGLRTITDVQAALHYARLFSRHRSAQELIVLLEDHAGTLLSCRVFPAHLKDPRVVRDVLTAALSLQAHSTVIMISGLGPLRKLNKPELESIRDLVQSLNAVDVYTIDLLLISGSYVFSLRKADLLVDEKSGFRDNLPRWAYWLMPLRDVPCENGWHYLPADEPPHG